MPCSCTACAGTKIEPHALASARSPGRAEPIAALPDLDDALDVRHLGGAPHGRGKAPALSRHFLAPVDVGVDLDDGERAPVVESLDDRDWHGIVAADDDRDGTPCEDGGDRLADGGTVRSRVRLGAGEVAAIDRGDRVREDRPADVEIDVMEVGRIAGDRSADGVRRTGAIGPDRSVGGRAGHAEDRDLRLPAPARSSALLAAPGRFRSRRRRTACRDRGVGSWHAPVRPCWRTARRRRAALPGGRSHSRAITVISRFDPPARPPDWVQVRAGRAPLGKNRR